MDRITFSGGGEGLAGAVPQPLGTLIVDDEAEVALQLQDVLESVGLAVAVRHSAEEAWQLILRDPSVGVILTDLRMAGPDGLELAQRVLDRFGATVDVIVMSGNAGMSDATRALRIRVSEFLQKPFSMAEVVTAVRAGLARAAQARAAAQHQAEEVLRRQQEDAERAELRARLAEASARLAGLPADSRRAEVVRRDMHAISHALRTPLVAIAGSADLLDHARPTGDRDAYLTILRDGVRQAVESAELLEEMHRLDQPDAAAMEQLALAPLMVGEAHRLAGRARDRGIAIHWGDSAGALVPARRTRLDRAIEHVMQCALDFVPDGGALRIAVAAEAGWCAGTVLALPAGWPEADVAAFVLPDGALLPESPSALTRSQETLRFAVARRLVEGEGGRLTSWNGAGGEMAMRIGFDV